jgi:gamma-glutamyltranspeptidase/glutathione hydrolase
MRRHALARACGALLALAAPAGAQETTILSGMDLHHPVVARRHMVAAQEALAAEVGRDVLRAGGNAVDAAVAVGFALAVTLPRAGNLGGGGFMLAHRAATAETFALDYRETAPAGASRDMFLGPDGEPDPILSRHHGKAVGVPGTVAGLAMALERWGTIPLAQALAPAIRLAEEGFTVTPALADSLKALESRLKRWPATAAVFFKPDGAPHEAGDTLRQPDLAATLRRIAEQGPAGFYRGETAARIAAAVRETGGPMTEADLAAYEAKPRDPVRGRYRGHEVLSMPPPSSGGAHLVQILNILEGFPLGWTGPNAAETIHLMAEAMKRAYADRSQWLGDSDFVDVPLAGLTSPAYAATQRALIDRRRAASAASIRPGDPAGFESDQTTHYSVVDADGNAVSNTYTINFSYGSGMVAEGTGVLLNNEMDDFSAKPGASNAYGLVGGDANAVEPGKRPLSSMSPTIVLKDGRPFLVTGSPGGPRIITTTLQIILNAIDHGMNIAEATAAPRIHHQWSPDVLRVEEGISPDTLALLRARGHDVRTMEAMGSTQSIMIDPATGLRLGASDPRTPGGVAVGD